MGAEARLLTARRGACPNSFGVAMRGDVLRREMRLRGLTGAALAGRRLHPSTFRSIAAQLAKVEVVPGAEALAMSDLPAASGAATPAR